jgi:hypothetical protein
MAEVSSVQPFEGRVHLVEQALLVAEQGEVDLLRGFLEAHIRAVARFARELGVNEPREIRRRFAFDLGDIPAEAIAQLFQFPAAKSSNC